MQNTTKIKVGDTVNVVFAWKEDENPSDKNFFTGKVKSIIRKGRGVVYFEFERLQKPVPSDRVTKA
jgi:hypothetical protein